MLRVLVIGASGYVGGRLSYLLAKEGYRVTALCYPDIPINNNWISMMENVLLADITSMKSIEDITDEYFDIAIHLVSLDHNDSNKTPNIVNSINVMPIWNLLDAFNKKKNLKKFIYFSTVHVYGNVEYDIIDETKLPIPNTPYGLTHLMAENICNMYNASSEIKCINLRMTNSYGSPFFKEKSCWWLVVNDLCRTAYNEGSIILQSDGSALRDFIHYNDILQAVKTIMTNSKLNYNTFHLSSSNTLSIYELAKLVRLQYKQRYSKDIFIVLPEGIESNINNKSKYIISNKRLLKEGFSITTSIEEGINELFNYLENNAE